MPRIINVLTIRQQAGLIGVLEGHDALPFAAKRFYFLSELQSEHSRGHHAHKALEQVIFPMSGSLRVTLDDGKEVKVFHLVPGEALHVPPRHWRVLDGFAEGTIVGVLASAEYDESDYIREYGRFVEFVRG